MSTLLTAHALHVETAFGPLFNSLSFTLKKGDRIGLIGHNGCGKSTLLQVLDGTLAPTSGSVSLAGQCLMARVEQYLPEALHTQSLLQAVLAPLPADAREAQRWLAERLLAQMGFTPAVMEQQTATLSGGQHTRLLLALDEPTNHLDMEGKAALAQTLRDYPGGVLLVSHDRQLISESCNRFWLIDSAGLTEWHSLEEVYARLQAVAPAPDSRLALQSTPAGADDDEEALLARLIDLEQWLADDMARKPKHQKPSLQAQWQEEIARLLNQLT